MSASKRKNVKLNHLSIDELRVEYETRLREELIKGIEELPHTVSEQLEEVVWKILCLTLGVRYDSWNSDRWELESDDRSALAHKLGERVLAEVELAIPDFIGNLASGVPKLRGVRQAYTKAYREHLSQLLVDRIHAEAHTAAKSKFDQLIADLNKSIGVTDRPSKEHESE